jgi:hypothetical protein
VFSGLLHSFRVYFYIFSTRFECVFPDVEEAHFALLAANYVSGAVDGHSMVLEPDLSVGLIYNSGDSLHVRKNYTRNEWGRYKTTLETSGEDVRLHSKRVGKMQKHTRNECTFFKKSLVNPLISVSYIKSNQ